MGGLMEYISKKVAAYGQFVLVLTQAMHGGVNGGILDLQINYVYLHLKILMGQCILLACQHP